MSLGVSGDYGRQEIGDAGKMGKGEKKMKTKYGKKETKKVQFPWDWENFGVPPHP